MHEVHTYITRLPSLIVVNFEDVTVLGILLKKALPNMFSREFDEVFQKNIFTEHFIRHNLPNCKYWLIF